MTTATNTPCIYTTIYVQLKVDFPATVGLCQKIFFMSKSFPPKLPILGLDHQFQKKFRGKIKI